MAMTPSVRALPLGHMPGLDGLRGSMLLLVLLQHFYFLADGATRPIDKFFFQLRDVGWTSMDVFFVMSGFLITGILLDSKGKDKYFRTFYIRRFLRIFPIYYATLFALIVVLPRLHVVDRGATDALVDVQGWYWSYLVNVRVATTPDVYGSLVSYTRHFWSLAVEEQYYLLWPAVVFLCGPRRLVQICIGMIITAVLLRVVGVLMQVSPSAIFVSTPTRLDSLALGSLMALVSREPGGLQFLVRWARPVAMIAGGLGLVFYAMHRDFSPWHPSTQAIGYTIVAFGAAGLVIIAATTDKSSRVGRFFQHPVLIEFGNVSYATYVTHPFVFLVIQRVVPVRDVPLIGGYGWPASFAIVLFLTLSSIVVGFLCWHLFEKHILKLKRYFRYGPRTTVTPPSRTTLDPVHWPHFSGGSTLAGEDPRRTTIA